MLIYSLDICFMWLGYAFICSFSGKMMNYGNVAFKIVTMMSNGGAAGALLNR